MAYTSYIERAEAFGKDENLRGTEEHLDFYCEVLQAYVYYRLTGAEAMRILDIARFDYDEFLFSGKAELGMRRSGEWEDLWESRARECGAL